MIKRRLILIIYFEPNFHAHGCLIRHEGFFEKREQKAHEYSIYNLIFYSPYIYIYILAFYMENLKDLAQYLKGLKASSLRDRKW